MDRKVSCPKLGYVNGAPAAFFGVDIDADFADRRIEAGFLFGGVQNTPKRFSRFGIIIIKLCYPISKYVTKKSPPKKLSNASFH